MNVTDADLLRTRRVWDFLQNEHDLSAMLERLPQNPSVTIGTENSRTELNKSAVASARYQIKGNPAGVLAVVGPMRMDYARVMSILGCVAECAGEFISELIEI